MKYVMQCNGHIGKSVLVACLLIVGVMPTLAQTTSEWEFKVLNGPANNHTTKLCLYQDPNDSSAFFIFPKFKIKIGDEQCIVYFYADPKSHSIGVSNHFSGMFDEEAISAAKGAGIIQVLEESIAKDVKNQRQKYLDDYSAANTLEALNAFEADYASNDPDGFIPLFQPKKNELIRAEYKNAFNNANTSNELSSFIKNYRDNDPDGLVLIATNKLDAIMVAEEKQRLIDKEAEGTKFRAENKAKEENAVRALVQLVAEHKSEIKKLGFSSKFLMANIYIYPDAVNRPVKLFTFETWLAALFESGKYSNIKKVEARGAQGVLLKRTGMQSGGILFKLDGGDLFPSHTTNADKAFAIISAGDRVAVSMMILSAVQ